MDAAPFFSYARCKASEIELAKREAVQTLFLALGRARDAIIEIWPTSEDAL